MTTELHLDEIQGNVTPGLRKNYQAFMLLRFPAGGAARAWLRELAPSVTPARAVQAFVERLKESRVGDAEVRAWHTKWVNVAISWPGLATLGAPGLGSFPEDFQRGLRERAALLADDGTIANWEVGGTPETEAHALVVLAADAEDDLSAEIERQQALIQTHGLTELKTYRGAELVGDLRGHEHFGYRDGISQPDKEPPGVAPAWGEFILGYPNETGQRAPGPDWTRNGSYVVFRRLSQDVAGFRRTMAAQASKVNRGLTPELLGAKLVGRWTTGAKLGNPATETEAPKWPGDDAARVTPEDFANDPTGERFPHFAHIRKANPRDPEARRHRLIRRGIPYGPPLAPGTDEDGKERGLLFLAYQASLTNQFEHIQRNWLNNAKFPTPQTGRDPLVSQPGGPHEVILPLKGGPVSIALMQFVTMTGGGYFFSPSIQALTQLANSRKARTEEAMTMADDNSRLGEFILRQDPYDWKKAGLPGRPLPANLDAAPGVKKTGMGVHHDAMKPFDFEYTPDQPQYWEGGLFWNLGDTTVRISKAVRIDYEYEDADGKLVRKGLVIGFEGAGGGD